MAEITANGVRFHVQRQAPPDHDPQGDAPVVVFLHGLVLDNLATYYLTLAPAAIAVGVEAICYDQRGHGGSERPPTGYSLADSLADLNALLDALDIHRPVHLIGNSYGGLVGLAFAATYPERTASLMLIEALVPVEGWGEDIANTLADAIEGKFEDRASKYSGRKWDLMRKQIIELLGETTLMYDMASEPYFDLERLDSVTCPVLAVYGAESLIVSNASVLQKYLPNLSLTVLPDHQHFMLLGAIDYLRDAVSGWLR